MLIYLIQTMIQGPVGLAILRGGLHWMRWACRSDQRFMVVVAGLMRRPLPKAHAMLRAWMSKSGETPHVPLMQDVGFVRLLRDRLNPAAASGSFHVPQWHLAHLDHRCALGSFDVTWRREGDSYRIDCHGIYGWSPGDEIRPTTIIHQAATRLKGRLALPWRFHMIHTGRLPASDWIPVDRVYL
jgi:hypothetical protein